MGKVGNWSRARLHPLIDDLGSAQALFESDAVLHVHEFLFPLLPRIFFVVHLENTTLKMGQGDDVTES